MDKKITIGPVRDIKTLIEILPLVRRLSQKKPSLVLSSSAGYLKPLLKYNPHISEVMISDEGVYTIDLQNTDPFQECLSGEGSYTYPWLYISIKERAYYHERLRSRKGPMITLLKDGIPHDVFMEVKRLLRQVPGIEPEVVSLEGRSSLMDLISTLVVSDLVVSGSVDEALLVSATGTPLLVITEDEDQTRERFRTFLLNDKVQVRDEFGPVVKICPPERDNLLNSIEEVLPKNRAIFFDRDGTLCEDMNYLRRFEDLRIFKETAGLRQLKHEGFLLIGVTNQSGIARGIVSPDVNRQINDTFINEYGFDGFYFCPHHPDEHCVCRKPSPGMLLKARRDHRVGLRESIVVGDKDADTLLARAVGAKAVLVTTGQQKDSAYADEVIQSLSELHRIVSH